MFLIGAPPEKRINDFLKSQENESFSYEEIGASRAGSPLVPGYVADHNRIQLGSGEKTFSQAVGAVQGWRMFDLGWVEVCWPNAPIEVDATVAVLGSHYGFSSLNACRIVYTVEEEGEVERFGFAYGTLPGHAAKGEERFIVEWDRRDDAVWYDLYAFSKPNHLLAEVGKPFVRRLQRRFAQDSMRVIARAIRPA